MNIQDFNTGDNITRYEPAKYLTSGNEDYNYIGTDFIFKGVTFGIIELINMNAGLITLDYNKWCEGWILVNSAVPKKHLEAELEKAVHEEDYLRAAEIKKELDKIAVKN
jgi:hypothetical protein